MASDFEAEVDGIAEALREALPGVEIEVQDPTTAAPGSFGLEPVEVLTIVLPHAADYVLGAVVSVIVGKLRGVLRRHRRPEPPSKIVRIYGPAGEVLKEIEVDDHHADTAGD